MELLGWHRANREKNRDNWGQIAGTLTKTVGFRLTHRDKCYDSEHNAISEMMQPFTDDIFKRLQEKLKASIKEDSNDVASELDR